MDESYRDIHGCVRYRTIVNAGFIDHLYLATGDNDGGDTKSNGIMKSTDGGVTWAEIGLPTKTGRLVVY